MEVKKKFLQLAKKLSSCVIYKNIIAGLKFAKNNLDVL